MVISSLMFSGFSSDHQNSQPSNMNRSLQNNSLSGGYRGSMLLCWTHATFSYFQQQHPAGNHAPDQTCKNNSILRVDMCIVCVLNVQCVCNDCDINQCQCWDCSWGHRATVGTIYPQVLIRQSGYTPSFVLCVAWPQSFSTGRLEFPNFDIKTSGKYNAQSLRVYH